MYKEKDRLKLSKEMCRNLYFMLCYAADETKMLIRDNVSFEDNTGIDELLGVLIINTLGIKDRGYNIQGYKTAEICSNKVYGRVDLLKSVTSGKIFHGELYSTVRKLDKDTIYNRIILLALSKIINRDLSSDTHNKLMSYIKSLTGVTLIDMYEYRRISLHMINVPKHYRPIMTVCKLVLENILASNDEYEEKPGELFDSSESQRYAKIFEKFVRNFYMQENKYNVYTPKYKAIDVNNNVSRRFIPDMVLQADNKALVIDTKWYTSFNTDENSDENNQNQIQRYLNKVYDDPEIESSEGLYGVILYADNGNIKETEFLNGLDSSEKGEMYRRVLNLNKQSFDEIKQSLIDLADEFLDNDLLDRL